jgi:hypothetical protein
MASSEQPRPHGEAVGRSESKDKLMRRVREWVETTRTAGAILREIDYPNHEEAKYHLASVMMQWKRETGRLGDAERKPGRIAGK